MNFLIIYGDKNKCDLVDASLKEINLNVSRVSAFDLCNKKYNEAVDFLSEFTHCIAVDEIEDSFLEKTQLQFSFGLMAAKKIPVYAICSSNMFNGLESFRKFDGIEQFIMFLKENIQNIRTEYEKKFALNDLLSKGISFTATNLAYYMEKEKTEICEQFFTAGIDPDSFTDSGVPLLCVASRCDNMDQIKWLLDKGADINVISKDRGYTPVMDAVWRKDYEITKLLIEKGADLSVMSSDGQSILVLAVGNGNTKIVELLLENGADPDIKDAMGMSARGYANLFKNEDIMKLMEKFPEKK